MARLARLRQSLGDGNIDYYQHSGYELFMRGEENQAYERIDKISYLNNLLKNAISGHDIYAVANEKIADFGFDKVSRMIYKPFEGQIDTGKMMRALLTRFYQNDGIVLNDCAINPINQESKFYTLNHLAR